MLPAVRIGHMRARSQPALALRATWLLGSLLAWGSVLALETLRHGDDAASVHGELAYLGRLATLQALLFSPLPLLLLGVRFLVARGVTVVTWTVAVLAVWPAWAQAT